MESFPLNSLLLLPSFPPCSSWTVLWSRLWFCSPGSSCWSGTRLCISSASSSASWEWDAWRAQMCLWEGIREQVSLRVHRVTCLCGWDQGKTWNVHGSWWKQGTWASYCLCLTRVCSPTPRTVAHRRCFIHISLVNKGSKIQLSCPFYRNSETFRWCLKLRGVRTHLEDVLGVKAAWSRPASKRWCQWVRPLPSHRDLPHTLPANAFSPASEKDWAFRLLGEGRYTGLRVDI